jgi:hypothetical protein
MDEDGLGRVKPGAAIGLAAAAVTADIRRAPARWRWGQAATEAHPRLWEHMATLRHPCEWTQWTGRMEVSGGWSRSAVVVG